MRLQHLLDLFRRRPPLRDRAALADFIDSHAAFLVQKGMYEYSRARAGHYAKVLMTEPAFLAAIDHSRWRAYPLGLAMVGEAVEKVLHPEIATRRGAGIEAIADVVLSVFDRYEPPASLGKDAWLAARRDLARRLELIGLHSPKLVKDMPVPYAEEYFGMMPIDAKLRAPDFPAITNYLRVTLINIHDELAKQADVPALAHALLAGQGPLSPQ
jgi:hypothetical protein